MKPYSKIVLLVVLVLLLPLTACTRQATTKAVNPTATGEAPFPFTTPATPGAGGVLEFGTQTAIARTPQVLIATNTPEAGGEVPPATDPGAAAPTEDPAAGGGIAPTEAPPAPAVATPVLERPGTYTLRAGEWPICIARRYNLDIPTFFAQNGLNMNSKPSAGTSLQIPSSGTWNPTYGSRTLAAHPTSYVVKSGDSVYKIACSFGDVSPEAILAVNGLSSANDVQAGMTLQIP